MSEITVSHSFDRIRPGGVDIIAMRQPPRSMLCGQYCVAMITHGDIKRAIAAFNGSEWASSFHEIINACRSLGVLTDPHPAIIQKQPKPKQCFVRIKSKEFSWWSHFAIYSHGHWWDPAFGTAEGYKRHPKWAPHMYQASYVAIVGYASTYKPPIESRKVIQEPVTADEWQRMSPRQRDAIVTRVFGFEHCLSALGPATQIMREMTGRGFSVDWTAQDSEGGIYCVLTGADASHVGYGTTLSESLCAAALAATGFLLQRAKPTRKFYSDESKAKTAEDQARSQLH